MTEARLMEDGVSCAVRLVRRLADPPSVVWRALTERDQLGAWFPCDVEVAGGRWEVGAKITFVFPPQMIEMTLEGEVLVADEPRALAFTWGEETLRFELSPDGDGTLLALTDELPRSHAARNAAGWDDCLDRLAGLVASPDSWRGRFDAYSSRFEAELGPQDGPPEGYKGG